MVKFLRRRRLGRTSVREVSRLMESESAECRSWVGREMGDLSTGDLTIRWGCTANIIGSNVLNTARAIHQVNDKAGFRMHLQNEEGDDSLVPISWMYNDKDDGLLSAIEGEGVVVRPLTHSRGRHVYLCTNDEAFAEATEACNEQWYASEYIKKVAEYRVFVVQGRAVAVAQKTPSNPDDIAWNVAQGGRFDNVTWDNWPLQAVRKSIEAFNLTELDFGGVDVMVDGDGRAYVIEINSAPSLTSPYRQQCMAKAFDYIVANGKERIPLIEERGGYRKFIHPALYDGALLVSTPETSSVGVYEDFEVVEYPSQGSTDDGLDSGVYSTQHLERYTNQQLIDELKRRVEV